MLKKILIIILCFTSLSLYNVKDAFAKDNVSSGIIPRFVTTETTNIVVTGKFDKSREDFSVTVRVTYKFEDNGDGQIIAILGTAIAETDSETPFDVYECTATKISRNAIHVRVKVRTLVGNDAATVSATKEF